MYSPDLLFSYNQKKQCENVTTSCKLFVEKNFYPKASFTSSLSRPKKLLLSIGSDILSYSSSNAFCRLLSFVGITIRIIACISPFPTPP